MSEYTTGIIDIKRAVTYGRTCTFVHYHDGQMWYTTEAKEMFPVPVPGDIGNATLLAHDRGIMFMRYMRKWNKSLEVQNG